MEEYNKISQELGQLRSNLSRDILSAGHTIGIILGIIGFVLLFNELHILYKINTINNWPIIKNGGIISDSYLQNSSGNTSYSIFFISKSYINLFYRTRASFIYKLRGKIYTSNKISFFEPWESNPIIAKVESDALTRGTKVDIRINPYDASEAYIYNKPYNSYTRLGIAIFLSIIGIYVIYQM